MIEAAALAAVLYTAPAGTDPLDGALDYREHVAEVVEAVEAAAEAAAAAAEAARAEAAAAPSRSSSGSTVWDDLAACESGGNWAYNGSSGYDGGLQFLPSTWSTMAPAGFPAYAWQATREQQIEVAEATLAASSWQQQWPTCSKELGLW